MSPICRAPSRSLKATPTSTSTTLRFHAALKDVRTVLCQATRQAGDDFVTVTADRYRIDPALVDVDLWRFQSLNQQALEAEGDERTRLLEEAAGAYTGDLAGGLSQDWIEQEREALRRRILQTLIQLAGILEDDEPQRALDALHRAITIDQYAEICYRQIMTLQARLGDRAGVQRTYRRLEDRLEDLNVDPDDETAELLQRLLRGRPPPGISR